MLWAIRCDVAFSMVVVQEAAGKVVVLLIVRVLVGSNELCSELMAPLRFHVLAQ